MKVDTLFEKVRITIHKSAWRLDYAVFIYPPNFIERFFGITFEQKVEKAKKKVQKKIDKLNIDSDMANKIAWISQP